MDAAGVASILRKAGQAMTLKRTTNGVFNPVTGDAGTVTVTSYTIYGITANYAKITMAASMNENNTLILSGDKKLMLAAGVVTPLAGDTITIQGVDWTIVSVDDVSPAGIAYYYECQARR